MLTLFSCCVHQKDVVGSGDRAPGRGWGSKGPLKLKHF